MNWGIIIALVIGFYLGVAFMCMMILSGRISEIEEKRQIKKIVAVLLIIGFVALAGHALPAWAGEKEELVLKQQLLQEKIARYEIQFQLLRIQFRDATAELEILNKRLAEIQKKEEAEKKAEPAKKELPAKKEEPKKVE